MPLLVTFVRWLSDMLLEPTMVTIMCSMRGHVDLLLDAFRQVFLVLVYLFGLRGFDITTCCVLVFFTGH